MVLVLRLYFIVLLNMAVKLKADIKTELDAVAAALTLAIADTVTGVAIPFKDPRNPLRDIGKFLDIDDAGVVTINDAKFNAIWNPAGTIYEAPTQGIGSGSYNTKILS